jgi:iron complex outermembrane receptor protein
VVLENPIVKGFPVFDLERIEVARGPQGTLFGRNTPAGIISFISKRPTEEFEAYALGSYGTFDAINLQGAVSGPVGEGLAIRASGIYQTRDDWVDNLNTVPPLGTRELEGFEEMAGRLQFLFTPSEETSILLNIHGRKLDGTARLFRANIINPGSNTFSPTYDRDTVSIDGLNFQDVEEYGGVLRIEHDFGEMTLTSVTGYENVFILSRGDIDGGTLATTPFPAETADGIPDLDQWSQEIRLASNDWEQINFQVGAYYFSEDVDIDSFNYAGPSDPFVTVFATQHQETRSWALFAHGTFDVTDQLILAAGVRYSNDEKEWNGLRAGLFGTNGTASVSPDDSNVAWDISATYAVNEDINVYARVGSSFRAPSIQGRLLFVFTPTVQDAVSVASSETNVSYELGVKSEFWENRGVFNLAAFYYTLEDQQLTAVGGAANANRLINAEETIGHGFEAELELAPIEQLLMTAGLSYNNTEINDADLAVAPCAGGCTVLDPTNLAGDALIDGNSLPNAPEWIANFTIRVSEQVGTGELYFLTDWAYRSRIHFFLYESAEFSDDHLMEGGVRIGYIHGDGEFEVALFGRNILDDESLEGGIDFNNLTGFVNEPATFGIEVGARF